MKYIYFHRTTNDFTDILKDSVIKPHVYVKISWTNYLLLGLADDKKEDSIISYVNLKFGDDIATDIHADFTPIPNKDYVVKPNP